MKIAKLNTALEERKVITPPKITIVKNKILLPGKYSGWSDVRNRSHSLLKKVGEDLKTLRESLGVSQRQLAKVCYTTGTTIGRAEKGYTQNVYLYLIMADALNKQITLN